MILEKILPVYWKKSVSKEKMRDDAIRKSDLKRRFFSETEKKSICFIAHAVLPSFFG